MYLSWSSIKADAQGSSKDVGVCSCRTQTLLWRLIVVDVHGVSIGGPDPATVGAKNWGEHGDDNGRVLKGELVSC